MAEGEQEKTVNLVSISGLSQIVRELGSTKEKPERAAIVLGAIMHYVMGAEWMEHHILAPVRDDTVPVGYVGWDFTETTVARLKQHRIYDLAEMLANLQAVRGFHKRVAVWRTWPKEKVEAMFAELQAASLLYLHNVDFRFVDGPKLPRGQNYDFEIYKDGETIFAEAKCKFEETAIDADSILNSLRDARKQVPAHGPSVIFVKIPEQWFRNGDTLSPEIPLITDRFLRSTGRILSVVYHTPFHEFEEGRTKQEYASSEVENHKCRFRDKTTNVFDRFRRQRNPNWIRVMDIVEGKL